MLASYEVEREVVPYNKAEYIVTGISMIVMIFSITELTILWWLILCCHQWRNVGYGRPPAGAPVAHLAPPVAP